MGLNEYGRYVCDFCTSFITHDQAVRYQLIVEDWNKGLFEGFTEIVHFCSKECQRRYMERRERRSLEAASREREARMLEQQQAMFEQQQAMLEQQQKQAEKKRKEEEHQAFLAKCVNIDGAYYSQDKTTLLEVDKTVRRLNVLDGVLEIAKEACKDCAELKSVTLPESLEELEESAFGFCSSLREIKLPKSLKIIGKWAFYGTGLETIEIPDGVEEIGVAAFGDCKNLQSVSLPESIKKYNIAIFYKDVSLKEVKLPEGMTEIPESMFLDCSSLSDIKLPSTVKKIGPAAFKNCTSLTSVQDILNQAKELGGGAFQNTGVTEITIPASIKKLEDYDEKIGNSEYTRGAFACCKSLKSVTIEEGKTVLGSALFTGCDALKKVSLPSTLKSIGFQGLHRAFRDKNS